MRLERWVIIGDGLWYKDITVPADRPLSREEILQLVRAERAVVSIYSDATGEFIGMIYASIFRPHLERIHYYGVS